jgi:hypothetical protein
VHFELVTVAPLLISAHASGAVVLLVDHAYSKFAVVPSKVTLLDKSTVPSLGLTTEPPFALNVIFPKTAYKVVLSVNLYVLSGKYSPFVPELFLDHFKNAYPVLIGFADFIAICVPVCEPA